LGKVWPREVLKMTTCSTKGCFAERQKGDSLFCVDCRQGWRRFCIANKLDEYAAVNIWSVTDEGIEFFKNTHIMGET